MPIHFRPLLFLSAALALALAFTPTCATTSPSAVKYPPHGGNCKIRVFHTPTPDVQEWDDIGIARVDCPLDVGAVQCLRKLRTEACKMGGDLLYDVPKKPRRPTEQGMIYIGHVAHTKERADDGGKNDDDGGAAELDPQEEQSSGPVQPVEPIAPIAPSAASVPSAGRPADGGQ